MELGLAHNANGKNTSKVGEAASSVVRTNFYMGFYGYFDPEHYERNCRSELIAFPESKVPAALLFKELFFKYLDA